MKMAMAPFRIGAFRQLMVAYGLNRLGSWLGEIALAVLVVRHTHTAVAVAAVFVAGQFVPSLLTPVLVARLEARGAGRALPMLLVGEAAIFVALAAVAPRAPLEPTLLLVALDGMLALAASALLKASVVSATSPHGLLREGNALLGGVFTATMAVGPCVAGVVVAASSPHAALLADAASFLLAAVALGARVGLPPAGAEHAGVRGRVRAAVGHVRERPPLRRLLVGCALVWACSAAILPLEVVLITDTLHAGGAAYGTVLSLWGLGAVAGSALVPKLRHHPLSALIVSSFSLIGVSYLGMGLAPSLIVVCAFSLLGGVGNGVEVFAAMTAIQEQTADAYQTPVSGLVEAVAGASTGAGFILGGAIASLTSARAVYVLAALGILVVTAFLRASPHRPQAVYA